MADNKKYSRISLDIAEEAEETFHVGSAGVTRVDPAAPAVNAGSAAGQGAGVGAGATQAASAGAGVTSGTGQGAGAGVTSAAGAAASNAPSNASATQSGAQAAQATPAESVDAPNKVPEFKKPSAKYEDEILTEEDLNGEVPFQKLRIGIIIVMALIVVAAVVYFNMGM